MQEERLKFLEGKTQLLSQVTKVLRPNYQMMGRNRRETPEGETAQLDCRATEDV